MRGGAPLLFGTGMGRGVSPCANAKRLVTPLPRSSGVQLHPTSLPGGRLGREAYAWVDWLAEAGQQWWQMLPLGPPDRYRSPYKAASAFAAWPGLLGEPSAPVTKAEELDFREREQAWIED
jgi:4-alpha-glucanotransferase